MTDLVLAIVHHLLVFGIFAVIVAEALMVRHGMGGTASARLARIDAGYGAAAALVLIIGILRLVYGAKGWDFYVRNPWFWAKMGAFLLVGLVSIGPTLTFLSWRRREGEDGQFVPPVAEITRTRLWLRIEMLLIALVIAFAAMMARWGQF